MQWSHHVDLAGFRQMACSWLPCADGMGMLTRPWDESHVARRSIGRGCIWKPFTFSRLWEPTPMQAWQGPQPALLTHDQILDSKSHGCDKDDAGVRHKSILLYRYKKLDKINTVQWDQSTIMLLRLVTAFFCFFAAVWGNFVKTWLVFGTSHYKCCSTCLALIQT